MLSLQSLIGNGSNARLHGTAGNPNSSAAVVAKEGHNAVKPAAMSLKECGYYDVQQVQEISRSLLYALGAASVEKTTGGLFNHPTSVVGDIRKEMTDYVQSQVDAYAYRIGGTNSPSEPVKVIQEILESFVKSKRSLFRRVSSRIILFGDKRDERIGEFALEVEKRGSWLIGEREASAKAYMKRIDRSNMNHCEMKFESSEQLAQHKRRCALRPLMCENENCGEVVAAMNAIAHDETCPLKLLPCEQNCTAMVLRGEMDDHCKSDCPMKLINCPFHEVGCLAALPQAMEDQHCSQFTSSHLHLVLRVLQKQQLALENQAQQILSLEKTFSYVEISEAVDIGSMSLKVGEQDAQIKVLQQELAKLRQDLELVDVSPDLLQLQREVRNLQKSSSNKGK